MKCACCADARVSTERELCPLCAEKCFPVVNGQRTVTSPEHRAGVHARRRADQAEEVRRTTERAKTPPMPTLKDAAVHAGKVFLKEAEKELIPNLVKLAEREAKKRLRSL